MDLRRDALFMADLLRRVQCATIMHGLRAGAFRGTEPLAIAREENAFEALEEIGF